MNIYAKERGEESMLVLTWGSTAVQLPTLDSRIIFSIFKLSERVKDPGEPTMQMLYKVFTWSLQALSSGYHPWEDHLDRPFSPTYCPDRFDKRGTPLADDFCGAFAECRGDWKWIKERSAGGTGDISAGTFRFFFLPLTD